MAFIEDSNHAIYLGISEGKIVRSHKQPNANTVERINKNGKVVYEEFFRGIKGKIMHISTKENDYGKFWVINLVDTTSGERYIVEFNYSGGVASAFLKALPNVNLQEEVELIPNMKIDGDKKKTGLFLNQNGRGLKWFWNKDNPGELPQLEQKKIKGKAVWDDSAQMEYLEAYVTNNILPQLSDTPIPQEDF